jgi:hypothetical protein
VLCLVWRNLRSICRIACLADELFGVALVAHPRAAENAPASPHTEPKLRALINDIAARPGKLSRARLVLATTQAHGIDDATGVALATAVEYFHIASLMLDDLPCVDDAQTRRGQPCGHVEYGEAAAIPLDDLHDVLATSVDAGKTTGRIARWRVPEKLTPARSAAGQEVVSNSQITGSRGRRAGLYSRAAPATVPPPCPSNSKTITRP